MNRTDLIGQRFGKLTVKEDSQKRRRGCILWSCGCDCGGEILAMGIQLTRNTVTSCGCVAKACRSAEDLTGRRFGKLTVLQKVDKKTRDTQWLCRCDCGNHHTVSSSNLKNASTMSCGCLSKARMSKRAHLHYVDGTCMEQLAVQKLRSTNTSGYRGVTKTKWGTYYAQIKSKGKVYSLGTYKEISDAAQARLEAEEVLHTGFLNAYRRWQERAEGDPAWAERNPFFYEVQRIDKDFRIITNTF